MNASRTRKEKFSSRDKICQKNVSDLEDSLVTSSRPSGQPQKRPDDRTLNAGVESRAADGSRRTHGSLYYQPQGSMADRRCCRRAMSEVLIQQSVMYCGACAADIGEQLHKACTAPAGRVAQTLATCMSRDRSDVIVTPRTRT